MIDRDVVEKRMQNSRASTIKNVIVKKAGMEYDFFQSYYMEKSENKQLKPNIVITNEDGTEILLETNSIGLKGKELDESKGYVGVWGDSVLFGLLKNWVEETSDYYPQYQFLNGAIEGLPPDDIIKRAKKYNNMLEIKYNILFPGWHRTNFSAHKIEEIFRSAAEILPNCIMATVPTALNDVVVKEDFSSLLNNTIDSFDIKKEDFVFWGNIPYTKQNAKKLFMYIRHRNMAIRKVAKDLNLPLIDLEKELTTTSLDDFRDNFFDIGHPRAEAYPLLKQIFKSVLDHVLETNGSEKIR